MLILDDRTSNVEVTAYRSVDEEMIGIKLDTGAILRGLDKRKLPDSAIKKIMGHFNFILGLTDQGSDIGRLNWKIFAFEKFSYQHHYNKLAT